MIYANEKFRNDLKISGIRLWEIAKELAISEATVTRRLRNEMTDAEYKQFAEAAQRIRSRRNS